MDDAPSTQIPSLDSLEGQEEVILEDGMKDVNAESLDLGVDGFLQNVELSPSNDQLGLPTDSIGSFDDMARLKYEGDDDDDEDDAILLEAGDMLMTSSEMLVDNMQNDDDIFKFARPTQEVTMEPEEPAELPTPDTRDVVYHTGFDGLEISEDNIELEDLTGGEKAAAYPEHSKIDFTPGTEVGDYYVEDAPDREFYPDYPDDAEILPSNICRPPPVPPVLLHESLPKKIEPEYSMNVLNMVWSFGLNPLIPAVNLSTEKNNQIFYVSSHTGIIYDYKANKQTLLQGHSNAISCTCVSHNRRWIVTGDKGPDSVIIVWDSTSHIPVKTIFDAHPDGGLECCALSFDARFLVTISAAVDQTIAIWDWTTDAETPICTAELRASFGLQRYVYFNPDDVSQLVSNSETQVLFFAWKGGKLDYYAPSLTDSDFNKVIGKFTQSIFFYDSPQALTATSVGNIVVWDSNKPLSAVNLSERTPNKKALKIIRILEKGIPVLTTTDRYIVMGDIGGHVKFYDQALTLIYAYHYLNIQGPINSLSFAYVPEFFPENIPAAKYPMNSTLRAKSFYVRNFLIGTATGIISYMVANGTDLTIIHRNHDAPVHAISTHPNKPLLVIGGYSGLLQLFQYSKKVVLSSRMFLGGLQIHVCCYDPKGEFIALGFTNGSVRLVHAISLEDALKKPFVYTNEMITKIAFSYDSMYMAVADAGCVVTIYIKDCHKKSTDVYKYLGRHKSHYKTIRDLLFGIKLDSNRPRLLSVGDDRALVEYDLENSTFESIIVRASNRIEQSSMPICMTWHPPLGQELFLLTSNNEFKLKFYNVTTKMCRKTVLGPTFGSPLKKILVLNLSHDSASGEEEEEEKKRPYLAYINDNKVGVSMFPLDGNPHNSSSVNAHPLGVTNMVASHDSKYLFTSGGEESTVHMWMFNNHALEAISRLGGEGVTPFYSLLEDGREGVVFKEIEQLFYYAQIKDQGIDTQEPREISTQINITEVPYMMRALGFYPSEQDIEEMLNELKFSEYAETGKMTTHIDLADFIKLYVNHRPAFGIQMDKLAWAFKVLGEQSEEVDEKSGEPSYTISRDELLYLLQNNGEPMTEAEIIENLTILLGLSAEGGSVEGNCNEELTEMTAEDFDKALPMSFTADVFSEKLLGLRRCEENCEAGSSTVSLVSPQDSVSLMPERSEVATQS